MTSERRLYLIDRIAQCLRLAQSITDVRTVEALTRAAADYQAELDQLQRTQ